MYKIHNNLSPLYLKQISTVHTPMIILETLNQIATFLDRELNIQKVAYITGEQIPLKIRHQPSLNNFKLLSTR